MKILLVEDDDASIALLSRSLSGQHYIVDAVTDGEMGWTYASTFEYDAIVLDLMLPKLDGITLCKRLRAAGYTMPIIFLTSQDLITAKVQGLDAGADDYLVKPFDLAEMMARMRALLRRSSDRALPLLSWENLLLDPSTCEVTYDGKLLSLTTKEYDLLELFLRDSCHVFSSDEIIDRLWSSDDFPAEATVRSHVRRLRRKLQAAGAPPDSIATIHGRGYYLKSAHSAATTDVNLQPVGAQEPLPPATPQQVGQQAQYRAFLQETWKITQPQCLERLTELGVTVMHLLLGSCGAQEQAQAHQKAHKLVGTLGVFGAISAMELARQIERLLASSIGSTPAEALLLPTLLSDSIVEVECFTVCDCNPHALSQQIDARAEAPGARLGAGTLANEFSSQKQPLLLMVGLEPQLTQSAIDLAKARKIQTMVLANIETANLYLDTLPNRPIDLLSFTIVLVSLANSQSSPATSIAPLEFVKNVRLRFPHWAVLALGEHDSLGERLAVVRCGGKFIGTVSLTAEQIFTAITACIQPAIATAKVMVVDDDLDWLRALPKLLEPWGIKVSTLADPLHFWTVLQSVRPDALILDIKMPEINGLELCQVLRSDPSWQHLPILFLSATNDSIAQQEAFSVGADDYLCKPMLGSELAWRIRHRLARLQLS
jgi:DNA-binding response OmpR family regulator